MYFGDHFWVLIMNLILETSKDALQSLTGKYRVFTGKLVYREIPITCFGSVQGLKGQILMKYREIYAFSTGISILYLH